MDRLKFLSLNVRGLGSANKSAKLVNELTHLNCDIVVQAEKFEKLWKGECFWSFGTGKSGGVAVIFAPNFSGKVFVFYWTLMEEF